MEPLSFVYFAWTLEKVRPAEPKARTPRSVMHSAELIGSAVTTLFLNQNDNEKASGGLTKESK